MTGKIKHGKLAVVMVRGLAKINQPIEDTLLMLNLTRKNQCVVVENNSVYQGMIAKVKDFVTWGEIDDNMLQELLAKRGELFKGRVSDSKNKYNYNFFEFNGKKYKKFFRLNPPQKGFGRKGIKISYRAGGALGYRGEKINDLLMRMI